MSEQPMSNGDPVYSLSQAENKIRALHDEINRLRGLFTAIQTDTLAPEHLGMVRLTSYSNITGDPKDDTWDGPMSEQPDPRTGRRGALTTNADEALAYTHPRPMSEHVENLNSAMHKVCRENRDMSCGVCLEYRYARDHIEELQAEIKRLRAAGTAMLNATTADDLCAAEAEWAKLMGWPDE